MTPPVNDTVILDLNDSFEKVLGQVALLHRERNTMYLQSPLEILPIDTWLAQVAIKGVRAQQAIGVKKIKDELLDTIVYSSMVLEQIDLQSWDRSRPE